MNVFVQLGLSRLDNGAAHRLAIYDPAPCLDGLAVDLPVGHRPQAFRRDAQRVAALGGDALVFVDRLSEKSLEDVAPHLDALGVNTSNRVAVAVAAEVPQQAVALLCGVVVQVIER